MKKENGPCQLGGEQGPGNAASPTSDVTPSDSQDFPSARRTAAPATRVVPLYAGVMVELHRMFLASGAPQEKFAEFCGLPDRYIAKMFNPDSAGGRQASWETVQRFVDGFAPDGVIVQIKARRGPQFDALSRQFQMRYDKALAHPQTRRQLLAEWGKRGGLKKRELSTQQRAKIARRLNRARKRKLSKDMRSKLASEAARARWGNNPKKEPRQ